LCVGDLAHLRLDFDSNEDCLALVILNIISDDSDKYPALWLRPVSVVVLCGVDWVKFSKAYNI